MIKSIIAGVLALSMSAAIADQFTWTGHRFDGSGTEARMAFAEAARDIPRTVESFEGAAWADTYSKPFVQREFIEEVTSRGFKWTGLDGQVTWLSTFDAIIPIHRNRSMQAFGPRYLNPNGYDTEVADLTKLAYGACATFRASVWGAKMKFILDDNREVDFEGSTKLFNSNYYGTNEPVYPITTLCFIDTEGFSKLTVRTAIKDPTDDELYLYTSDWFDFIGPLSYTPDFSHLVTNTKPAKTDPVLPQGECEEGKVFDGEECQDDPNWVEPEDGEK